MRRSANFLIPTTLITLYYVLWVVAFFVVLDLWPEVRSLFPVGGMDELAERARVAADSGRDFEPVYSSLDNMVAPGGPLRLAIASIGAAIFIIPVSWAYFITSRTKEVDQSFVQTIIIMPIVVTGLSMIVVNSIALAFSLAGIVAAVRFRFTLDQPSHAMYIFVAISIGLAAGIGALGIAAVISMAFVYTTLIIWKLEYGKLSSGVLFSMLTRRDNTTDDDY